MDDRQSIIAELVKRRDSLDPDKRAIVDELSKRMGSPEKPAEKPGAMSEFLGGFGEQVNPVGMLKGLGNAVMHPIDTATNIVNSQLETGKKAIASFQKGEYGKAASQALNTALPLIGPAYEAAAEDAGKTGNTARNLGRVFGITAATLAGEFAPSMLPKSLTVKGGIKNSNLVQADALNYLSSEGVNVPAGAATGNNFVKSIQKGVDHSLGGSLIGAAEDAHNAKALSSTFTKLSDEAHPKPTVPAQAGEALKSAGAAESANLGKMADQSYDSFRQAEAAHARQTGGVGMPFDLNPLKAELKPLYASMQKWMEPAKRNASEGFQAVKSIVEGPGTVSASEAEIGLGGLKQLAREGDGRSAGIAKMLIPKLQAQIDATVSAVDQGALQALQNGRHITAKRAAVDTLFDKLRDEPVQAFGQTVYAKDAGIDRLKDLAKVAPHEMPKLGRAFLEEIFDRATSEGGWKKAQGSLTKWENLGPQTKEILYPNPALRSNLDKFFIGAKTLAENPNPSGTATTATALGGLGLVLTNPAVGISYNVSATGLSALLHSPKGVQLLTNGMKIPISAKAHAAFNTAQILKLVGNDAQQIEMNPSAQTAMPQLAPAQ